MDEAEWLISTNPAAMLLHLKEASDRKLRLFACACVRRVWHLLTDPRSRNAVIVAEKFADGLATKLELAEAAWAAWEAARAAQGATGAAPRGAAQGATGAAARAATWAAARAAWAQGATGAVAWAAARAAAREAAWEATWEATQGATGAAAWAVAREATWAARAQSDLLRDILGNPFRPVTLCGRNGYITPQVLSLAHAAYAETGRRCDECKGRGHLDTITRGYRKCEACHGTGRIDDGTLDPFRLALISDALEETGCDDEECEACERRGSVHSGGTPEWVVCPSCGGTCRANGRILAHLRSPGPHVIGCWAIDLILGLE